MAKQVIEVEILAVLKEATKSVKDFSKDAQKQLDSISFKTAVSAINDGFELIEKTAGRAFDAVKGFIGDAITEATEGEEALTRVANSMRLVGDFTETAVDDFKSFADALQETTTNSDDAVLSALALAKNFGLTNAQAKQATAAAVDFAAATDKDLDSAVQAVARTFTGFVEKDLAKYAPALKQASAEQLVLGEGARAIGERFKGFAEALGNTFQGSLTKTRNGFNNLLETIGELIISNPVLIQSIQIIGDVFKELTSEVTSNKEQIGAFISETIKGVAALTPAVIQAVKGIDIVLTSIKNLFQVVGMGIGGLLASAQQAFSGDFDGAKQTVKDLGNDILDVYRKSQERQKGFYDPLIKAAETASARIQQIGLGDLKKGEIKVTVKKSDAQIIGDLMEQALANGGDKLKKQIEDAFNEQKKVVETLAKNPLANLFPAAKPGDKLPFSPQQQNAIATGAGALNSVLGGAAGAQNLFKGLASAAADALVPGLGAVAGEIIGVLSQGPEKVKQMIQEFVRAIPDIIENIVLSIPVLIEELSKAVPQIIEKLTERIPEIVRALAEAMPDVAVALALQMPRISIALIEGIIKGIPDIIAGFVQGLVGAAGDFVDALIDAITGVGGDIWGGITGKDSGGIFEGIPILGGIGDIFGFATGGTVPDVPRYANDGFGPIMAEGGEEIIDKTTSNQLREFLAGQTGNQTIIVQVGQQELARAILNLNRGGFRLA